MLDVYGGVLENTQSIDLKDSGVICVVVCTIVNKLKEDVSYFLANYLIEPPF